MLSIFVHILNILGRILSSLIVCILPCFRLPSYCRVQIIPYIYDLHIYSEKYLLIDPALPVPHTTSTTSTSDF